uniref:Geminin coiled-coil domain containing n=1 Tax=Echeneis naucrates TaxID=173247 RepID=A0A665UTC4_ECHNA
MLEVALLLVFVCVLESHCVFNNNSPAGLMWTAQLSPHLQRNKQLHDTLLQREEQLARLQEENSKLREFLSSSFVRTLEEKAKVSSPSKPFLMTSQSISKRVCRNLTAEFCSEYSDEISASSEPNLDLWVLQTLGLKDRDTIDTSSDSLSFPGYSLRSLVYDSGTFQFSSPRDSTPVSKQPRISRQGCNPSNLSAGSQPPSTPQTPRSQADLAFSMFLSQSSSVKTHSFPQGQAFIRKDAEGRWNFTWVPRQGP